MMKNNLNVHLCVLHNTKLGKYGDCFKVDTEGPEYPVDKMM